MFIIDTTVTLGDGVVREEVREVSGLRAHLAVLVDEAAMTHPGKDCSDAFCLLDPPRWAWNLGVPGLTWRLSLGHYLWRLGQWAAGYSHPAVRDRTVPTDDPVVVAGWDEDLLADALRWPPREPG